MKIMTQSQFDLYKRLAWETGEDLEIIESYGFDIFVPRPKHRKRRRHMTWRDHDKEKFNPQPAKHHGNTT